MASKPTMTRAQMVAIIRGGESVMHNSRLISTEAELPSEVEMAGATPGEAEALIAQKLKERDETNRVIEALQRVADAQKQADEQVAENADSGAANGPQGPEGAGSENGSGTGRETGETGTSKDALVPAIKTKTVGIK